MSEIKQCDGPRCDATVRATQSFMGGMISGTTTPWWQLTVPGGMRLDFHRVKCLEKWVDERTKA